MNDELEQTPPLVLKSTIELGLLAGGLESAVTELGGGIDEGQRDLLVWLISDLRSVSTLFLVPITEPFSITQSLFTTP